MDSKDKKILELISKYLIHRGCQYGEISVDYYTNKPYYQGTYRCGDSFGTSALPFDISNTIYNILEDNNDKIFEEYDSYDGNGYINEVIVQIHPNERKFKVYGSYQFMVTGEEETGSVEIPEDIVNKFISQGITQGRVEFNGGGDSGYIEDTIYIDGEDNKSLNNIDDSNNSVNRFLERCLDDYGDWYNNEGASGSLDIDTEEKLVTWSVFPNVYEDQQEFLFEVDF